MVRPFRLSEWIWPVCGAALLVASGLVSGPLAATAARDGLDVYLFLAGMIGLAELARVHGVFDWIGAAILGRSSGNAATAFGLVYVAGIIVTALLSNDGTVVLLTPAVLAMTKGASLPRAPYLYSCAFVANAASFVLPISNPANLIVFRRLPTLGPWLSSFGVASVAAIAGTFVVLRWFFRHELSTKFHAPAGAGALRSPGRIALIAVSVSMTAVIIGAGAGIPVGRIAFGAALVSLFAVACVDRTTPRSVIRDGPWSIIPLVAGLFVIVQALDQTGVLAPARDFFRYAGASSPLVAKLLAGGSVTVADSILNNLSVGVLTRYALHESAIASHVSSAALIGIDLGPNLSLSGSLATLLWLLMLRRDGIDVSAWKFFALGTLVTFPALILALLCLH